MMEEGGTNAYAWVRYSAWRSKTSDVPVPASSTVLSLDRHPPNTPKPKTDVLQPLGFVYMAGVHGSEHVPGPGRPERYARYAGFAILLRRASLMLASAYTGKHVQVPVLPRWKALRHARRKLRHKGHTHFLMNECRSRGYFCQVF